jgi:hypothetical protein
VDVANLLCSGGYAAGKLLVYKREHIKVLLFHRPTPS